jgi:hypothetical protein
LDTTTKQGAERKRKKEKTLKAKEHISKFYLQQTRL